MPTQRRRRGSSKRMAVAVIVLVPLLALARLRQLRMRSQEPAQALADDIGPGEDFDVFSEGFLEGGNQAPAPVQGSAQASCFEMQPWVDQALNHFFKGAQQAAAASRQTNTAEALAALKEMDWGSRQHSLVTLRYNEGKARYEMEVDGAGLADATSFKRDSMLALLDDALQVHSSQLADRLHKRALRFVLVTSSPQGGVVPKKWNWRLPVFTTAADASYTDIPVPDFSYMYNPHTHYVNSSWEAVRHLLLQRSQMLPWRQRRQEILHRSNWGSGKRQQLLPLLDAYRNSSRDVEELGARLNLADTARRGVQASGGDGDSFVWLDSQCDYRYHLHVSGSSYSTGLKYSLACGSVVLKLGAAQQEFFEPALKEGVHFVQLGDDVRELEQQTVPRIKEAVLGSRGPGTPSLAQRARNFVGRNLTTACCHCYWLGALLRYGEMY